MQIFKNILSILITLLTIFLLADPICNSIESICVKVFGSIESVWYNDVLIILLICVTIVYNIAEAAYTNNSRLRLKRLVTALCIIELYLYVRISRPEIFVSLYWCDLVAYADLIFIAFFVCFVSPYVFSLFKNEPKEHESDKYPDCIIGDDTHPEDRLGRKSEVDAVYKYLLNNNNDNSRAIAIAITGTWGSGKTTFLNYFKDKLKDDNIAYFDYNPWNRSHDNVSVDFLTHLESRLHQSGWITRSLRNYIQSIKVSNATGWFSLLLEAFLHLVSDRPGSTQEYLEDVKIEMSGRKKPIVAIIDDIDRVNADDFRDVLGLVRSTADFPNLVYIVAYDAERAVDLLGEGGNKYLSKIFNVTHALIPIDEDLMQSLVGETLNDYFMHCSLDNMYDNPLSLVYVTSCMGTIRDMYRFVNMMYKDYKVQQEVRIESYFDFKFWTLIELLKYHDYVTWCLLQSEPHKFLDMEVNDWCAPTRYKLKDNIAVKESTRALLSELFNVGDSIYRSPDYLPLVFANYIDLPYLKKSELNKAIQSGDMSIFRSAMSGGVRNLYISMLHYEGLTLAQLIEIANNSLQDNDDFKFQFKSGLKILRTIKDCATQADMSEVDNIYSPYYKIRDNHELYLMFDQYIVSSGVDRSKEFLQVIKQPNVRIREMMAVVYGLQQMDLSNSSLPPQWKAKAALDLTERLLQEYDMRELINQFYMMEAFEYLHVYDHVNMFVMPVVKKNPAQWLGLSIRVCTTITESLLLADVDVLRTMFDTHEVYTETMKTYEQELIESLAVAEGEQRTAIEYNLKLINEHRDLVKKSELTGVYSESVFEDVKFPTLKEIACPDCTSLLSMGAYYNDLAQRLRQKDVPFYFGKSRHPQLFE